MNIYIVICDIKETNPNYQKFFNTIHSFPSYCNLSENTWLIANTKTLNQTYDRLYRYFAPGDNFVVLLFDKYRGVVDARVRSWLDELKSQEPPQY